MTSHSRSASSDSLNIPLSLLDHYQHANTPTMSRSASPSVVQKGHSLDDTKPERATDHAESRNINEVMGKMSEMGLERQKNPSSDRSAQLSGLEKPQLQKESKSQGSQRADRNQTESEMQKSSTWVSAERPDYLLAPVAGRPTRERHQKDQAREPIHKQMSQSSIATLSETKTGSIESLNLISNTEKKQQRGKPLLEEQGRARHPSEKCKHAGSRKRIPSDIPRSLEHTEDDVHMDVDSDAEKFVQSVDKWTGLMRRAIIADFLSAKSDLLRRQKAAVEEARLQYADETASLTDQLRHVRSQISLYTQRAEKREQMVDSAMLYMERRQVRMTLMAGFSRWRVKQANERRIRLASKLARQYAVKALARKCLLGWQRAAGTTWRKTVERKVRMEAEKSLEELAAQYEQQLGDMRDELDRARSKLHKSESSRSLQQQDMKKAFMRGVCALNMEAMSMFRGAMATAANEADVAPGVFPTYSEMPVPSDGFRTTAGAAGFKDFQQQQPVNSNMPFPSNAYADWRNPAQAGAPGANVANDLFERFSQPRSGERDLPSQARPSHATYSVPATSSVMPSSLKATIDNVAKSVGARPHLGTFSPKMQGALDQTNHVHTDAGRPFNGTMRGSAFVTRHGANQTSFQVPHAGTTWTGGGHSLGPEEQHPRNRGGVPTPQSYPSFTY
ncbi:hypothetical protein DFS34DRAFT_634879 [Phlyctochytrium arcticum]|nr:hypothetical protein DFS34DRAFT_634879 [Phlyctochytrium arcticum]